MATKPVMQTPIAINFASKKWSYVSFYATPVDAKEFEQFGQIFEWGGDAEKYSLSVDHRFNFDEVVAYIECYCNE